MPKLSTRLSSASFLLSILLLTQGHLAQAADMLPTGGQITAGTGAINQTGNTLIVTQNTDKMAVDWQSFSIGQNNSVTFNQPSSHSIALNRVLGSDVSVIQGKLTANGQIFLINPNGVLFTPSAQVNTGALVASTMAIKTEDFLAGNYRFNGTGSNAIINQGNITTIEGGTVALIAAKIINTGTITAPHGNVLQGAGSQVTLDLGGPVKIQVDEAILDAFIDQGGAIKADGGTVYLTAKAANDLATTVINHTGITEANTLSTNEKGQIVLLGDFQNDRLSISGTLKAEATGTGDGGFIETSAANVAIRDDARFSTRAQTGNTGTWLLDPTNITIDAGNCTGTNCLSANTIQTNLGSTNVSIATDSGGAEAGNITLNAPITWSANKLTLSAHNNLEINGTLTATNTATLAFLYGQGSADGGASTYTIGTDSKIYIPAATAFTWKKGSGGTLTNLVFNNSKLRFGNGTQTSINTDGQLEQPFYYDNTSVVDNVQRNGWFALTFSTFPLDIQVGAGGDGSNSWNTNGELLTTNNAANANTFSSKISNRSLEISGYKEGTGVIVSSVNLTFTSGDVIKVQNTYTLGTAASFLKTDTTLTNLGGSSTSNMRLWVGTRDDYIATADQQFKFKGNLAGNGFEQITAQTQQAKALKITEFNNGQGAAVLFYSTSAGADTSIAQCCRFSNTTNIDPRTSLIYRGQNPDGSIKAEDGSYSLFIRLANLAPSASDGMTWYYAAAPVAEINQVVTEVETSAGVTPPPPPAPPPTIPMDAAIQTAQIQPTTPPLLRAPPVITAPPSPVLSGSVSHTFTTLGNLNLVNISTPTAPPAESPEQTQRQPQEQRNRSEQERGGDQGRGGDQEQQEGASQRQERQQERDQSNGSSGGSDDTSDSDSESTSQPEETSIIDEIGQNSNGFLNVFVVNGGLNLPADATTGSNKTN